MKDLALFFTVGLMVVLVAALKENSLKDTTKIEMRSSVIQQTALNVDPVINQVEENQI